MNRPLSSPKRSADPPLLKLNIVLLMALPGWVSCCCSLLLDIALLLLFRNTTYSVLLLLERIYIFSLGIGFITYTIIILYAYK